MLDIKLPDPPTSPFLISLNGFCGRKAPCFLSFSGHHGERHFVSFCDVSTPDLAAEKSIRYTARLQTADRPQPNSVCMSACALNKKKKSNITSKDKMITD